MKYLKLLAGLTAAGALLMFCACVPKGVIPGGEAGELLFARAENQYNQGFYNSAVTLYQDYLDRFPKGENVSAALLRVGDVLSTRGEYADARRQYDLLIERFPDDRFAEEARIGILLSWYNEKQYRRVLDYADTIDDRDVSDDCVARKYIVVSDAYLAMEEPVDGAYVLISGLRKVGGDAQKKILIKLNQVSGRIGAESLQELLAAVKEPDFRGYLSCQIADRYIQKEDYAQAMIILSDFMTAYPHNAYAATAAEMMRRIDQAAVYDRYAIGCLLPLTGEYRLFGERALRGIQFAFQEFVTAHARAGKAPPIKLIVGNTGSNPAQAVSTVKALADKKVAAIIGPLAPFTAAIQEAENRHIPIIALSQEQNIPVIGKYVFRNFLTPRMQVDSLADYACRTLGLRKFAVLYPDEEYGKVFAHMLWDAILQYGGEMVGFESFNPAETDFAEPIKKLVGLYYTVPEDLKAAREQRLVRLGLKEVDTRYLDEMIARDLPVENTAVAEEQAEAEDTPQTEDQMISEEDEEEEEEEEPALVDFEALFIPDGPSNAGLIIPQLAFHDIVDTLLMGTNLWYSRELMETAGWYAQGAVLPADFWESGRPGSDQSFSFRYERFYNEKPSFVSAVAYDTAAILMNIINDPGVRYRHSIVDRLEEIDAYPGVTGLTDFDKNGEVRKVLTLLKIKGKGFQEIRNTLAGSGE